MAPAEYNASFSGAYNYGLQAGYIWGNVETHHHYPVGRPETPPSPSFSIPFLRDPDFVDRGTILNQLHDRCAAPGSRTALVGLGGVGKSQLAIEYAYRIHEREPETWGFWIYASNATRFEQSYRDLADTVKLFGRQDPKANIFKLVHDWLRDSKNGKWMIILDNVDDAHFLVNQPAKLQDQARYENTRFDRPLREYLPRTPNGWLLITSRSKEAALKLVDQRNIIVVDPMDETHARALFAKKLGEQNTSEDITELATALEYIPLAIVQAAAYISDPDRGCSVRQYLIEFQKSDRKKIHLLDHEESQFRRDWEAKNSILKTWQISFDSIFQRRRSAADLLPLMSFFDCQGIPEALLRNRCEKDAVETHRDNDNDSEAQSSVADEFNNDILVLRRYSLIAINVDRTTFSMHNLVQLATRRWLEVNGELEKWRRQYVHNLNAGLPPAENENFEQYQVLYPHAKLAARHQPQERDSLLEWAEVLYRAAWYDWRRGSGLEGKQLLIKSIEAQKELLGPEHEVLLYSMQLLGLILNLQGRWKDAEELLVQVMEIRKKKLGAEHPYTLSSIDNLASTYRDQGRLKEAEELFTQVLETNQRLQGAEHPETLSSMASLASAFSEQGRWKEAEELLMRVMEMGKLGGEHPNILSDMANLARMYSKQGRGREAEELFVQVMETGKRALGAEHVVTMSTMTGLASMYHDQARWKEAEELFVQVLETTKRLLGAEHPVTLTYMSNLALVYQDQGRWNEAEELLVQAMQAGKRVLGADHRYTLNSIVLITEIYTNQGRWKEAEELLVQVVEMRRKALGAEHPDTLVSMVNLASTYRNQRRWKEAEELLVRSIETIKTVIGTEHPNTLIGMDHLASTYRNQERWKEMKELEVQVIETRKRVLGAEHPETLSSMANLALAYSNQERWKEAEELLMQVVEIGKRVLGAEHVVTMNSMNDLAATYMIQERWKEAEELLVRSIETRKKVLGIEHPNTLASMANLAFNLKEQGRGAEALDIMKDCVQLRSKVLGVDHPATLSSSAALTTWLTEESHNASTTDRCCIV